jgi:hypothetical protein
VYFRDCSAKIGTGGHPKGGGSTRGLDVLSGRFQVRAKK